MKSKATGLALPKNWPQGVKAAVLHVIVLARVAIVHARKRAVNSSDVGTRRAGDLQGALDEIAMLEEEFRIKNGRMAMIDPHRRPYYPRSSGWRSLSSKPHEVGRKLRQQDDFL